MSNNNNGKTPERPVPPSGPRPPHRSRAGLIWLLIFIMIGSMLLFKTFCPEQQQELNQTEFERRLQSNNVKTINMIAEGDNIFRIEGEMRGADNKKESAPDYYITRVVMSDSLQNAMRQSEAKSRLIPITPVFGVLY